MASDTPIRDVMTKQVVTLTADMEVTEAARLLQEHAVSGAPVVDDKGTFIGMLEDEDLIATAANLHVPTIINVLGVDFALPWENRRFEEEFRKVASSVVGDLMKTDFPSVTEDATVGDVASLMRDEDVARVVVVDVSDAVVGIVARSDLVRSLATGT